MPEHRAAVAHQFESAEQQYEASTLGMWIFLVTEIMFFGGLFTGYTIYRASYPEAFAAASRHLELVAGAVNTAVLIGSSLTMALAVHAAQLGRRRSLVVFLLLTIVLGSAFLGIKAYEYTMKFEHHLVPGHGFVFEGPYTGGAELFFGFYFAMTGMHALHMIIGVAILSVLTVLAWRDVFRDGYFSPIEIAGLYWHFVDIVWIFLFPLLYLISGRS